MTGNEHSCVAWLVDGRCVERFAITVDDDGMVARLLVKPGPVATIADLRAWLASEGIVAGIDDDALQGLTEGLEDQSYESELVVARGVAAVAGTDGSVRGERLGGPVAGTIDATERIDFRERALLPPIKSGEVVAEVVAATTGTHGQTVTGEVVAAECGAEHTWIFGDGVVLDGCCAKAVRDGVVVVAEEFVDVVPLYTHDADVDYYSGNLHSEGSFVINGSICTGFRVTAAGDVVVAGDIQRAAVSANGSVHVGMAIIGCEQLVRAGGDITCHHTVASRLSAGRAIVVADQVHEATLYARRIEVRAGRGVVRGARLQACDEIHVTDAGSPAGTATVLAVAQPLEERKEHADRALQAARLGRSAARARDRKSARAASRAGDAERAQLLRLRRRQRELLVDAVIRVDGTCHEGVVLRFGTVELRPEHDLHGVVFRWNAVDGNIEIGAQQ